MRQDRWRIVLRLLDQVQGTSGLLVMALAPRPLDVVLYEVPVLARTQPPRNPLRGFVQDAVALLGEPTASDIAGLLHLPQLVVDLVLGNLQQMGSLSVDSVGRWTVPKGAPVFRAGREAPPIWRRERHLLCYWFEEKVMLPVLPRLRLRDLVELGVHQFQGDVQEWYTRFAALSGAEAERRGLPAKVKLLPLSATPSVPAHGSVQAGIVADSPVPVEEVLVSRCKLDVIALSWATLRDGVWELSSRLWCRPTPPDDSDGEPFAPGEPFVGLSLPEYLLGGQRRLDRLAKLFDPKPDAWETLLSDQDAAVRCRREFDSNRRSLIVAGLPDNSDDGQWLGLPTVLAPEARLICWEYRTKVSRE